MSNNEDKKDGDGESDYSNPAASEEVTGMDLGWISKLLDEQLSTENSNFSDSPDQSSSSDSGYGLISDSYNLFEPVHHPLSPLQIKICENGIGLGGVGTLPSDLLTFGQSQHPHHHQQLSVLTPSKLEGVSCYKYFMSKGHQPRPYRVNNPMDVFIHYDKEEEDNCLSSSITPEPILQAFVTHSSGLVQEMLMEKVIRAPNPIVRGSFFPHAPGPYSVTLYENGMDLRKSNKVLGCPLEFKVSRDYPNDAEYNPIVQSLAPLYQTSTKFWGMAADPFSHTLYISDRERCEVIGVDPCHGGEPLLRFGQNPTYSSQKGLYRPTGMAVDPFNKRLIICDKDNHRIVFFSMDGAFISSFGKKGHLNGEFNYPWDVAVAPTGDLIVVTDSRNHRVQLFDRFGNYLRKFSVFETHPFVYKEEFDFPRGVTFANDGSSIYITDFNTNNVVVLNVELTGYRKLIPEGKLCRPQGITVDDVGNILFCDSRRNCIRVINSIGDLQGTVHRVGKYSLIHPANLTLLSGGELAVMDTSGRIRIF